MADLKQRLLLTSFLSAVAVASCATAGAARAQTAIDEVVVTARRVEENIQTVPLAITALSGEALERRGVQDITGISSMSPNLAISDGNTGAGTTIISLRGQNQTAILITTDPAVGLYIDGVNVPLPYGTQAALFDIKRVEVLNGPQGTLYGRNTTGGAVSFYTNDPGPEPSAEVSVGGGNHRQWSVSGIANLPLTDKLAIRLVGEHNQRDGYGKNLLTGRSLEGDISDLLRAKIKYDDGRFSAVLGAEYVYFNNSGRIPHLTGVYAGGSAIREVALAERLGATPAALAQAQAILSSYIVTKDSPNFYNTWSGMTQNAKVHMRSVSLNLDYKLSEYLSLRSISGHRSLDSVYGNDNDGTPYFISGSAQPSDFNFYSEEFQVLGGNERHNWVLGVYYHTQNGRAEEPAITNGVTNNFNLNLVEGRATGSSYAVFAQGDYKLTDSLSVTLGGRWTREKKGLVNLNHNSAGCTIGAAFRDDGVTCRRTSSGTWKAATWLASINYNVTDDIFAYVKASRGFKSGSFPLRASGAILATYASVAPERVQEFEVGLKSLLFDKTLRVNLAAFRDKYSDIQRTVQAIVIPSPLTFASIFTNAAEAHLTGFEAQVDWRVTPQLSVNGTVGTFDAKYDEFIDFTGDRSNEPWPSPDLTYSVGATYSTDLEFGRITGTLTYTYQSNTAMGASNARNLADVYQGAYGLLNGTITLHLNRPDLEVQFWGTNLANRRYWANSINLESVGFNQRAAGAPRMYGVKFTQRF